MNTNLNEYKIEYSTISFGNLLLNFEFLFQGMKGLEADIHNHLLIETRKIIDEQPLIDRYPHIEVQLVQEFFLQKN